MRTHARFALGNLLLVLLFTACDPRHTVGVEGEEGSTPERNNKTTSQPDAGPGKQNTLPEKAPPPPVGDCVVAMRLNACCPTPEPMEASALADSPCLVRYASSEPVPAGCAPNVVCTDTAECEPLKRALSVFAERGEDGQCRFANECEQDSDCELATDARSCCPCVDSWPVSYVATQRCVVDGNEPADSPPDCLTQACDPDVCPPCATMDIRPKMPEAWCLKPPGIGPTRCAVR